LRELKTLFKSKFIIPVRGIISMEAINRALRMHADDNYTIRPVGKEPATSFVIKAESVTDHGCKEILNAIKTTHNLVEHYYDKREAILLAVIAEK